MSSNKDGWPLYKINPDYHNRSTIPDYLGKKTIDIFDQIDYHAIKLSIYKTLRHDYL